MKFSNYNKHLHTMMHDKSNFYNLQTFVYTGEY